MNYFSSKVFARQFGDRVKVVYPLRIPGSDEMFVCFEHMEGIVVDPQELRVAVVLDGELTVVECFTADDELLGYLLAYKSSLNPSP